MDRQVNRVDAVLQLRLNQVADLPREDDDATVCLQIGSGPFDPYDEGRIGTADCVRRAHRPRHQSNEMRDPEE